MVEGQARWEEGGGIEGKGSRLKSRRKEGKSSGWLADPSQKELATKSRGFVGGLCTRERGNG